MVKLSIGLHRVGRWNIERESTGASTRHRVVLRLRFIFSHTANSAESNMLLAILGLVLMRLLYLGQGLPNLRTRSPHDKLDHAHAGSC